MVSDFVIVIQSFECDFYSHIAVVANVYSHRKGTFVSTTVFFINAREPAWSSEGK